MILDDPTISSQSAIRSVEPPSGSDARQRQLAQPLTGDTSLQAIGQLGAALSSAPTLDAAAACCLDTLDRCFEPAAAQLVWGSGPSRRVFDQRGEEPRLPDTDTLAALLAGQVVLSEREGQVQAAWAPLMARAALAGWLYIAAPAIWDAQRATLLAVMAGQAGVALTMVEVAGQQDERLAQLQTLAAVGQHVSGTLDLDELLEAIHNATARAVDADDFFIALYEAATATLELAYIVVGGERRYLHDRWPARVGLGSIVLRERAPLYTDDYSAECLRRGVSAYPIAGLAFGQAWLGVPLIARDTVVGIMAVSSRREGIRYNRAHVDLMMTVASQASVAIENARLYRRSEHQARQLVSLNRIGRTITSWLDFEQVPSAIMEQVLRLLEVEEGSLMLLDQPTGDLVFAYTIGPVGSTLRGQRVPAGTGLAGYVVTSGQSVIANDVQRDGRFNPSTDHSTGYTTRRLLAVPLRGVSGVVGVIEVLNRRDNSPFTDDDRRLLEALSDYAVIAIENARRFAQVDQALARRAQDLARMNDQLQHSLRSLTALNALGMAINTSLRSPDEVYRMTTHGVVEMTGALGAWVILRQGRGWRTAVTVGPALSEEHLLAPLLQRIAGTGRPELMTSGLPAPFTRLGARALHVVPLRAPRELLGCLCVGYADQLPDMPDRETVVLFATQAAAAVESMQLFNAISIARDQMASILASTRDGMMLVGPDARIALVNARLGELCGLGEQQGDQATELAQFLAAWERQAGFAAEEWQALQLGLVAVTERRESFVGGELNDQRGRVLEWAALQALSSGDSHGGALLVLRDITEAKESEQLREDLTHMIVHDLRSPLSSVMASIDMLVRGVTGELNGSQQYVLTIANDSSQQMLAMINTLLDINRLEAGRMPLTLEPVDVCAVVRRAAEQLASLAHERRVTIETGCDPETPTVTGDGALIVRVAQNLIANAIKFSGRGSAVSLGVAATAEGVLVSVRDRGVGIAPKDRDRIFAKFGQVGERRGGTGLGLTFCKLVVEALGGRIWVESQVGEGSSFFFVLPVHQPAER